MTLFEARIEILAAAAEMTSEWLVESEAEGWSVFEDVIVQRAWVLGVFTDAQVARTRAGALLAALPPEADPGHLELRELPESEWRDSYKAHFRAWQFGRLHWVPIWEQDVFRLPDGDAVLWLDPGLAFGTGNHETTRLCVERLVEFAESEGTAGSVIDAGCGSGILALSAAKLGFGAVAGFDNDSEAVRVSGENALLNGLHGRVRFFVGELGASLEGRQADLVMANILADVLICHAPQLIGAVRAGGALILSGILAVEREQVQTAFSRKAPGWKARSRTLGDWCDVVLTKPNRGR